MNAKISEIFTSLQGEGKYPGVLQVFIRFFGCQLNCVWCDTPQARDPAQGKFQEMEGDSLLRAVLDVDEIIHSVSLTGGEPLLQRDFLKGFLPRLKQAGRRTYLDTNGIEVEALKDVIPWIDIVAADIKLPSSCGGQPLWTQHAQFLQMAADKDCFVKAVITLDTTQQDMAQGVDVIKNVDTDMTLILQPEVGQLDDRLIERCREFQSYCLQTLTDVRIVPQMHKLLGIR